MFTSLQAAKDTGAITFDWSDTGVIVYGLVTLIGEVQPLGVCVTEKPTPPSSRRLMEHALAIELGIVSVWQPEDFRP